MKRRELYFSILEPTFDMPYIKFLVGPRCCGKTRIFLDIIEHLKTNRNVADDHIIYINFEYVENTKLRDIDSLESYIRTRIKDDNVHYIFFDEIYLVDNYERLLNKLWLSMGNLSVFLACSNSRSLKENLNSLSILQFAFFYITPFGYKEACEALNAHPHDKNMLFNYLKYGGLPERFKFRRSSEVKKYLYSALDSIFLRDVVMRLGTKNVADMFTILKYLIKHFGTDFSAEALKKEVLAAEPNLSISDFTMALDALEKSLLITAIGGYSVQANVPLLGLPRYYLSDLSLTFLFGFDFRNNMDQFLKNLVWIELKRRGYDVYQGYNGSKCFDFVAKRGNKIFYMQVVEYLEDGSTINKEIEKFANIEHLNKKYLLSLDRENYSRKGVIHRNIIDFLMDDISDIEDKGRPYGWVAIE